MINDILEQNGFSKVEARAYLAVLELGVSHVSKISRKINESRENSYYILDNLEKKGYVSSIIKNKVKCYSALHPKKLYEKFQRKTNDLLEIVPDLLALASANGEQTSIQVYEGIEAFKEVYKQAVLSYEEMEEGEDFLTFVGTQEINPVFQKRLLKEFVPWRLTIKTKTKVIMDKKSQSSVPNTYSNYNEQMNDCIVIDDPNFSLSDEIAIYGKKTVSLLMYGKGELSAVVIKSKTLHEALKSIFMLIRNIYTKQNGSIIPNIENVKDQSDKKES